MNVSIIIPHQNTPDLLVRCLNTIPDCSNIQVIIVDDNSNPAIVDFDRLQNHNRRNTTVILAKEGKGAGYARNIGLKHAKGEWLLFADSDDFFVEGMYDLIKSYEVSEADMILFKAKSVNSDTLESSNRNENINTCIDNVFKGLIDEKHASVAVQSPWCRLIKRKFVEDNNIQFDEVIACNDTMFTTKCSCLANSILVSQEYLYVITFRKGSLWDSRKTNPDNLLTRIRVQIQRNNYVRQFGFDMIPILGYVIKASNLGFKTFFNAVAIAIRERALFQGVKSYIKKR